MNEKQKFPALWKVAGALVSFALIACSSDSVNEPKYSRSECIVKIDFNWQRDISTQYRNKIQAEIGDQIVKSLAENSAPAIGISYDHQSAETMYIIFTDQCEKRFELTEEYMAALTQAASGNYTFMISHEAVIPSENTINIGGEHWTDG